MTGEERQTAWVEPDGFWRQLWWYLRLDPSRNRILRLQAEVERLQQCLAVAAPPEGGPVVAISVSTLEQVSAENERLREALRQVRAHPVLAVEIAKNALAVEMRTICQTDERP